MTDPKDLSVNNLPGFLMGTEDRDSPYPSLYPQDTIISYVSVKNFGAVGDGRRLDSPSTISLGSSTFQISSAIFSESDVGKAILIYGIGAEGAPLITTIAGFINPTRITLSDAAAVGISGVNTRFWFGTDNTVALQSALSALSSYNKLEFSNDTFLVTSTLVFPASANNKVINGNGANIVCLHYNDGLQMPATGSVATITARQINKLNLTGPDDDYPATALGVTGYSSGSGINFGNDVLVTQYNELNDCIISNFKYGIRLRYCQSYTFVACFFKFNKYGLFIEGGPTNANRFLSCSFRENRIAGVYAKNVTGEGVAPTNNTFIGGIIETNIPYFAGYNSGFNGAAGYGIRLSGVYDFVFSDIYFENHSYAVVIDGSPSSDGNLFEKCRFATNGPKRPTGVIINAGGSINNKFSECWYVGGGGVNGFLINGVNSTGNQIIDCSGFPINQTLPPGVGFTATIDDGAGGAGKILTVLNSTFSGTISDGGVAAGTILNVTSAPSTPIFVGMEISGSGVTAGTRITGFATGIGGTGTYSVSVAQLVSPATTITAVPVAASINLNAAVSGYNVQSGCFIDSQISGTTGGVGTYLLSASVNQNVAASAMYTSTAFTGAISGTTLTVTGARDGSIILGSTISGLIVPPGTTIASQISGTTGSNGTYTLTYASTGYTTTVAATAMSLATVPVVSQVTWPDIFNQTRNNSVGDFYGAITMPSQGLVNDIVGGPGPGRIIGIGTTTATLNAFGIGEVGIGGGVSANTTITSISGGRPGQFLVIRNYQIARILTIQSGGGTGSIVLKNNRSVRLNKYGQQIVLYCVNIAGGRWYEVGRNFSDVVSGVVTFGSADTTKAVVFADAGYADEPDANYTVQTCVWYTPAAGVSADGRLPSVNFGSLATTGFTIALKAAPGSAINILWNVLRSSSSL